MKFVLVLATAIVTFALGVLLAVALNQPPAPWKAETIAALTPLHTELHPAPEESTEPSDKPDKYEVGTCLRNTELVGMRKTLGYFMLIVDKTPKSYVMCQGQYSRAHRVTGDKWYGCDVRGTTRLYNNPEEYVAVPCPDWEIEDEGYGWVIE